jgi:ArsR family transcriptional regulator
MLELAGGRPIGTLLDIGTGTGRILELFAPHITRGVGIDLSHDMLSVARANLDRAGIEHCHVRQGDMYHPDFPAGSFDMAIFHQVLHFADDPGRAVVEAARLLAPGGRMIIADFAPHTLEFLRSEHAHRRLGFSDDEVVGWLRGAGLALAQTKRLKGSELTMCLWLAEEQDGRAR